ncbi:MAG: hypothetical protein IJ849_09270 [Selenomonadaceae bacterium]|nr:hypothetical protein [Selenomonadaceae bacterium]
MEILRQSARRLGLTLAVSTAVLGLFLALSGKIYLLPALIMGYFLAGVTLFTMGSRLWRSIGLSVGAAKRQMWWGLFLRLLMLFLVLGTAIRLSVEVFMAAVGGFVCCYGLGMAHLARAALDENREIHPKEAL